MTKHLTKVFAAVVSLIVLAGVTSCGDSGDSAEGSTGSSPSGDSAVIDVSFTVKTLDPARAFEQTTNMVHHAIYQTLLTFDGDDVSKVVDGLASYELSDDDTVMTLTMKDGNVFSDGSPVTVDDAVFSLQRVQGIQGNPSFLLDGVTIEKTSDTTLTLTSEQPNAKLAFILPNPSLGIVNSKVVKEHGGTTDETDGAEAFLNKNSAGSGPYVLESADPTSKIVLTANPEYTGDKPAKSRIVLLNVEGETESLNIQSGEADIALSLSPDQVAQLDTSKVNVAHYPSTDTIYISMNTSDTISDWTSNADFRKAVKLGIDYDKVLAMAGEGAKQPGGVVPSMFLGALPTEDGNHQDVEKAKAALASSGYQGEPVTMNYANDFTTNGITFQPIAETIQAQLKDIGIDIELAPSPQATQLGKFRAGELEMVLTRWGNDYPDPANYIAFLPDGNVGKRAQWTTGASPKVDELAEKATAATGDEARDAAWKELQAAMNENGPFIPLFQPVASVVTAKAIDSFEPNAVWTIGLASIK